MWFRGQVLNLRLPRQVDELNSQPEIERAPNQRVFRFKVSTPPLLKNLPINSLYNARQEKTDKYVSTYDSDPVFLAFKASLEKPEEVG